MTTIAELNARRKQAGLPLIRFHVRRLSAQDKQDLRDAFAALYEISDAAPGDSRGYWAIARGHGYDQDLCHNDNRLFLTWHRAYIYTFEKALKSALQWKRNDLTLELTLPYWDWTQTDPTTDAANGIPKILDDPNYQDATGAQQANPLHAAKSLYRTNQGLGAADELTVRYPRLFKAEIPNLASAVAQFLDSTKNRDFGKFTTDLDRGVHSTVHVRVGGGDPSSPLPDRNGDMAEVVSAAYDPIFWLHHAMVDKVWFDWATSHPDATVPQHVLDSVVYGGMKGSAVIDAENSLRYIYSDQEVETAVEVGGTLDILQPPTAASAAPAPTPSASPALGPASTPVSTSPVVASIGKIAGPFSRAQLDFHQLHPPKRTYEIRAFLNKPDATNDTPMSDPSYAGRLMLFGHGTCHGAPGHCNPALAERDEYDLRPQHPLRFQKTRYAIDVTEAVQRLLSTDPTAAQNVELTLVVLDNNCQAVPASSVKFRGVSLSTWR